MVSLNVFCLTCLQTLVFYTTNAFIKSCFSYCILYWFNNDRSGCYKLINKVDNLIALFANCSGLNFNDFLVKFQVQNVLSVHKMQSLLLMYDICHNKVYLSYIHVTTNNTAHGHFTRSNCNLHIPQFSMVDKHNCILCYIELECISV